MRQGPDLLSLFGQIHLTLLGTHNIHVCAQTSTQDPAGNLSYTKLITLGASQGGKGKNGWRSIPWAFVNGNKQLKKQSEKKHSLLSSLVSSTIIRACVACLIYVSGNGCNMKHVSITYKYFPNIFILKCETQKRLRNQHSAHMHMSAPHPDSRVHSSSPVYIYCWSKE